MIKIHLGEKEMKGGKQKENNQNKSVGKVKECMSLHLEESAYKDK